MLNQDLRDYLKDTYPDAVIFDNPNFDNSIVGITEDGNLVYSLRKMVIELSEEDHISYDDAYEFIDYNTLRVLPYITEGIKPIIYSEILYD